MAYRRRQQQQQPWSTGTRPPPITTITPPPSFYSLEDDVVVKEVDSSYEDVDLVIDSNKANENDSLAAKAIRASSAAHTHRDSSLSSAYAVTHPSPTSSSFSSSNPTITTTSQPKEWKQGYAYTSMKTQLNEEPKQGFWGSLARKAKSILDDDNYNNAPPSPQQQQHQQQRKQQLGDLDSHGNWSSRHYVPDTAAKPKNQNAYPARETYQKTEPPALQKGLHAISSSLNYLGNAVEEGLTVVENRTADIIQETRKHMRKKPNGAAGQNQATNRSGMWQQPRMQTTRQPPQKETDQELQLKASRDVAMAMAAKAKLLLRELKTVKADLAFAKERCAQLEEENKILRENRERGENLEDDDLIRLQLETLLAEKARLAHENSVYARENRFLREVVEYHQLTMQDVVYLDEGTEDVTEVYPIKVISNNSSIPATSPPTEASFGTSLPVTQDILPHPVPPPGSVDISQSDASPSSYTSSIAADIRKHPNSSV